MQIQTWCLRKVAVTNITLEWFQLLVDTVDMFLEVNTHVHISEISLKIIWHEIIIIFWCVICSYKVFFRICNFVNVLSMQIQTWCLSKVAVTYVTLEWFQLLVDAVDVFLEVLKLGKCFAALITRNAFLVLVDMFDVSPIRKDMINTLGCEGCKIWEIGCCRVKEEKSNLCQGPQIHKIRNY